MDTSSLTTADGVALEAEWAHAKEPRAAAVLCHPHPLHGGTMRSIVISTLFETLPRVGVTCLRFNFRGVEGSEGDHGDGHDEQRDAEAAVDAAASANGELPLVLAGWSFGADVALSVADERIAGWLAVACPLRYGSPERAGQDPRPKQLVLAEHDEFRSPGEVEEATQAWPATELVTVAGASHFFVGRTDRVGDAATGFVDRLTAAR